MILWIERDRIEISSLVRLEVKLREKERSVSIQSETAENGKKLEGRFRMVETVPTTIVFLVYGSD